MKQRKPRLDHNRIPYAVVSVDKLIEIAERIVALESEVAKLRALSNTVESQIIECIVPHISSFQDGKIFVRAEGEDGKIHRAEVVTIGKIEEDPEY